MFFGADAVGKVLWPHVIEFVDRLALRGREQRKLLAQFGPEAGFRNLRFNREAQWRFYASILIGKPHADCRSAARAPEFSDPGCHR